MSMMKLGAPSMFYIMAIFCILLEVSFPALFLLDSPTHATDFDESPIPGEVKTKCNPSDLKL